MMPSARVITVSTRAAAGRYADEAGPHARDALAALGFDVEGPVVVADGSAVETALLQAIADRVDVVVTSGGTGVSPTDRTPDTTRRLLDYEIPGIAEAMRLNSAASVPTSMLSRGVAGVAGRTLVINLPGSPAAVRDGMAVLAPVVRHVVEQLHGLDHSGRSAEHAPSSATEGRVVRAEMTADVLDVSEHESLVARDDAGAVVGFGGVVRDNDAGRRVSFLDYVVHPDAAVVIAEIAAAACARPGVLAVAVSHRSGELKVGEVALACAVSAAHRGDAFDGCRWLVEEIKHRLPVWKRQVFVDGTDEWVNCP